VQLFDLAQATGWSGTAWLGANGRSRAGLTPLHDGGRGRHTAARYTWLDVPMFTNTITD
jgi:hypothetical protein